MKDVILAIDCGTQSLRVILFSSTGELIDKEKIEYEPYFSQKIGWAEQDPAVFWQAVVEACKTLKSRSKKLFDQIIGVGVTTQRDSMVNVDREGNPLRPVITWLDQRKARPNYYPQGVMRVIYKMVGMYEPLIKVQTDAKCNWIQQNQPEIWNQTYKYLQVSGFLNHKLSGEFADSIASQIGHIPFNYKKMTWASPSSLNSKVCPVEQDKLPRVVPAGTLIGHISVDASDETGIKPGVPVIACGSDKGCETIGMGVLDESMASLSFGTTATVQTTTKKYCEALQFMPPYPAPIPGHYNPEVEIFRGYWMITWFKNEFAHKEMAKAKDKGVATEVILDELLKKSPPGAMGLVVQPYWGPGLKKPAAKGAMIGFGDVHKKAHVYRGVIEGLAYALYDGLHKIEGATKKRAQRVAVSGGASQSDEICQISADIFNLPLVRGKTFETSGLGAAIVTAVGLGIYPSFEVAISNMVQYDKTFEPNQDNVEIYQKLFHRVYQKLYPALQKTYEEIREITGYPEKIA